MQNKAPVRGVRHGLFYLALAACASLLTAEGSCPEKCFCPHLTGNIHCARKGLLAIPLRIPEDTIQLSLNDNKFTNRVLVRKNFSRFINLQDLFLSGCGIEAITVDTFSDLRRLNILDLSNNNLQYIKDYTFRGLSLKHLFLNTNPGIQFAPKAFSGFRTIGLYLKDCGLQHLSLEAMRYLNGTLKAIWLDNNLFEKLLPDWYYVFKGLSHVRLENNPLHCNCEMSWLYQIYKVNNSIFVQHAPSCQSPPRLKGKPFQQLTAEDFRCQLPILEGVNVLFGPHVGKLTCRAGGDPTPTLYWVLPNGSTEIYLPSKDETIKSNEGILFIHSHQKHINTHYKCVANNPAGNVTFTLRVTWPLGGSDSRQVVTTLPAETNVRKSSELSGVYGRSSNQSAHNMSDLKSEVIFSLVELIGAIIGTFLLTLLVCIVVFHFFYKQQSRPTNQDKDRSEKRRTPENHYVMADLDESSIKMMDHKERVS